MAYAEAAVSSAGTADADSKGIVKGCCITVHSTRCKLPSTAKKQEDQHRACLVLKTSSTHADCNNYNVNFSDVHNCDNVQMQICINVYP